MVKVHFTMSSYKRCTHPHTPTLTHTHLRPAKKRSHSPTPTHTQPKKGHTHPHPPTPSQKRSHPPTLSHKKVTPTHTPTHNWKKECHVSITWYIREKYSLFTILAGVFIFEKDFGWALMDVGECDLFWVGVGGCG